MADEMEQGDDYAHSVDEKAAKADIAAGAGPSGSYRRLPAVTGPMAGQPWSVAGAACGT